jgi:hypothetical protein
LRVTDNIADLPKGQWRADAKKRLQKWSAENDEAKAAERLGTTDSRGGGNANAAKCFALSFFLSHSFKHARTPDQQTALLLLHHFSTALLLLLLSHQLLNHLSNQMGPAQPNFHHQIPLLFQTSTTSSVVSRVTESEGLAENTPPPQLHRHRR